MLQFEGAWSFVWGLSPPKPPRRDWSDIGPLNIHLHAFHRKAPVRSMQNVLVAL